MTAQQITLDSTSRIDHSAGQVCKSRANTCPLTDSLHFT